LTTKIVKEVLRILEGTISNLGEVTVEKASIGLGYTGVKLSTGHAGVCHTLSAEMRLQGCAVSDRAGTLAGSQAVELAWLSTSWHLDERIVGIATVNALSQIVFEKNPKQYRIDSGNLIDAVEIKSDDNVVLVGNIRPFIPVIKAKTRKLHILERNPFRDEDILPDIAGEELLPKADVIIITGSAVANGTLDHLLELSRNAREVVLSGPSASFLPDPLFKLGVKAIGGIQVVNAELLLQIVGEGGGTRQIRPAIRFVNIKPN
jgi:uncharacterized protein (DUF4213/DUF364 family)